MAYETITTITKYTWLSTEAKPTGCNDGSTGFERDTGKYYVYSTISGWVLAAMPIVPFDSSGTEIVSATAALQTTGNTSLATIAAKDFATQTTLEAILSKIIAAPATAALQTTGNASLANLDIALTVLRDAILGTSSKTITDVVSALGAVVIAAGANVIGKVGIDQTTPGTTNAITPVNSSGTEILTETDPGVAKISDAGIIIPTDKQAVYRNLEVDYSTPLAASGSYTSSAIDGLTLRRVTGTVYADQAGTLNIEESKDGTTYRITATQAITASTPYAFDAIFHSRYIRLNYVNGASAQGAFELIAYSAAE